MQICWATLGQCINDNSFGDHNNLKPAVDLLDQRSHYGHTNTTNQFKDAITQQDQVFYRQKRRGVVILIVRGSEFSLDLKSAEWHIVRTFEPVRFVIYA